MKINTFPDAINATKLIEEKMSSFLSQELSDTIINLRKFLCRFGDMMGVSEPEDNPPKKSIPQNVEQPEDNGYKFSWVGYLKKDFKRNGKSTINDVFDRFFESETEPVNNFGDEQCKSQLRSGVFHLKKHGYLTKDGEGRDVEWVPTAKLMNEQ